MTSYWRKSYSNQRFTFTRQPKATRAQRDYQNRINEEYQEVLQEQLKINNAYIESKMSDILVRNCYILVLQYLFSPEKIHLKDFNEIYAEKSVMHAFFQSHFNSFVSPSLPIIIKSYGMNDLLYMIIKNGNIKMLDLVDIALSLLPQTQKIKYTYRYSPCNNSGTYCIFSYDMSDKMLDYLIAKCDSKTSEFPDSYASQRCFCDGFDKLITDKVSNSVDGYIKYSKYTCDANKLVRKLAYDSNFKELNRLLASNNSVSQQDGIKEKFIDEYMNSYDFKSRITTLHENKMYLDKYSIRNKPYIVSSLINVDLLTENEVNNLGRQLILSANIDLSEKLISNPIWRKAIKVNLTDILWELAYDKYNHTNKQIFNLIVNNMLNSI